MRFKRPQVRYADTPQPATPYQAAAQVWDDRIGSARVQAKNWRLMAFGCLVLALLMAGGLVWRSAQSIARAISQARARIASVRAFIDISMRRTSGWRMIATLLRVAAPISVPWIRSRA